MTASQSAPLEDAAGGGSSITAPREFRFELSIDIRGINWLGRRRVEETADGIVGILGWDIRESQLLRNDSVKARIQLLFETHEELCKHL
jgi:hypothetical protein